jgi:hypothetical protein
MQMYSGRGPIYDLGWVYTHEGVRAVRVVPSVRGVREQASVHVCPGRVGRCKSTAERRRLGLRRAPQPPTYRKEKARMGFPSSITSWETIRTRCADGTVVAMGQSEEVLPALSQHPGPWRGARTTKDRRHADGGTPRDEIKRYGSPVHQVKHEDHSAATTITKPGRRRKDGGTRGGLSVRAECM